MLGMQKNATVVIFSGFCLFYTNFLSMATMESSLHKLYVRGRVGAELGVNKSLCSSSRTFTENFVTLENEEGLEKVSGALAHPTS